jgi:hypothetical protein
MYLICARYFITFVNHVQRTKPLSALTSCILFFFCLPHPATIFNYYMPYSTTSRLLYVHHKMFTSEYYFINMSVNYTQYVQECFILFYIPSSLSLFMGYGKSLFYLQISHIFYFNSN